ncbi:UNVERIFIED_ORG: uncharacterized protein (DUF2236 family) [Variovorax paradoxus]|jgi:uncharacterized protein (DUF2236 family)|nr:uncharacterized protein (DUF2236 family) [Variovorax paradoxus]
MAQRLWRADGAFDFSQPVGEQSLIPPESVSWRIFNNPVSAFVGGVAAVILELAEPSVRSGVWGHSRFRGEAANRLQRTGMATMMTIYGAHSDAAKMIAAVVRRQAKVTGTTADGRDFHANDVEFRNWVQATVTFGFAHAYSRYVHPLGDARLSRAFAEAQPVARLYGAVGTPISLAQWWALLGRTEERLEASPLVFDFLKMMQDVPLLSRPLRPLQRLMIRGAIEIVPPSVRVRLGLDNRCGLRMGEETILRQVAKLAENLTLRSSPAVQACRRLGLPEDYLSGQLPVVL